ncbi:MAG: STAS-like domain-containing protein [Acidobacteriaceae bacterium]|jgi:hypothetical protein|nr:STAS-like domain-containing protein [Acidobacteriaceae bacterium]
MKSIELKIASDFGALPGPRKISEGAYSGEAFLNDLLRPRYLEASRLGSRLRIDFDGAAGYPTSFLEEAFGGLSREFGGDAILQVLEFKCLDEPYLEKEIVSYIQKAKKSRA